MKIHIFIAVILSLSVSVSAPAWAEKDSSRSSRTSEATDAQPVNTSRMKLKDVMPPNSDKSTLEKLDEKRTFKPDPKNPDLDIKIGPTYSK